MNENKRIVANSFVLYIQLFITTVIGLYTTRIVLLQLGADDFGLYSVVGGIVSMMGFLSTAMLSTSYRYIAVELGKGDQGDPNRVFNTTLVIHLALSLVLLILGETLGIWYIKNYLNIDPSKISDAIFVLHWSVIASVLSIAIVPFQGLITARENFKLRALVDIIKALLKLAFTILLILYLGNKLRAYALMMALALTLPSILLIIYARKRDSKIVAWKFNRKKSDYGMDNDWSCCIYWCQTRSRIDSKSFFRYNY
jgi:O-antigen/teichoic acid export membrane protein